MKLEHFLEPCFPPDGLSPWLLSDQTLKSQIKAFSLDEKGRNQVALIGIPEARNTQVNQGCQDAPRLIREHLYRLSRVRGNLNLWDLGNIRQGKTINDSYFAVREVTTICLGLGIIPLFIGGSQDLMFPIIQALKEKEPYYNLTLLDNRLDLGNNADEFDACSYLNWLLRKENAPEHLAVMGLQNYYCRQESLDWMVERDFDIIRLGHLLSDFKDAEPFFRDSQIVGFDISCVRGVGLQNGAFRSPNGIYPENACQAGRFAGASDKVKVMGLFEVNGAAPGNEGLGELAAQILWHFLEGVANRYGDYPIKGREHYRKHVVSLDDGATYLVFYNNPVNNRWWLEIPYGDDEKELVSCSYRDYQEAFQNRIPDRYLRWIHRLGQRIC